MSMTDPDARIMKQSDGGYAPSYNLQLSTDATAGIIIGVGVSQRSEDVNELMPAIERIEENLGKIPRQVVADGGYTHWENIVAMNAAGIDFIGSLMDRTRVAGQCEQRGVGDAFRPEHFVYDEQNDTYTCPEGKIAPASRTGKATPDGCATSTGHAGKTVGRVPIRSSAAPVRRNDVQSCGVCLIRRSSLSWRR